MRNERRLQIIFDLDTALLEAAEKGSSKTIYSKIRAFMERNGFDHIEYSGYVSREPMRVAAALAVVRELKKAFPILNSTVQGMHLTEVGDTYELTNLFGVGD